MTGNAAAVARQQVEAGEGVADRDTVAQAPDVADPDQHRPAPQRFSTAAEREGGGKAGGQGLGGQPRQIDRSLI